MDANEENSKQYVWFFSWLKLKILIKKACIQKMQRGQLAYHGLYISHMSSFCQKFC